MRGGTYRVGQIVPSSNTTMETEIPAILRGREAIRPSERFTFHSSRMRMKKVTREELAAMDGDSDRCALELSDASVDVLGYACLVATMSMGHGYHRQSQERLHGRTVENGHPAPVVTSAGALIDGLGALGARKIAMITPYMKPLTQVVADYIEAEGFTVVDRVSLEVEDNLAVGRLDPLKLIDIAKTIDLSQADVLVLSACVQMPSLPAIQLVEDAIGKPVISSAVCTTFRMLEELGLETVAPDAGALLSGAYARRSPPRAAS
ncbi:MULTISPECIES: maleate cis-trans isomerase family protein [unclassified Sphingomonas]|uniref:maleate cis-trans isomerase family protein n=1 Tax=unclassified Sphingomonas TaxID=196159 RepID=UPI0006FC9107|nr:MULTISPECIES: Asp/Glu racemase [unclassified Sphingomonas]KQX23597.1 Asp/Glu racemase [Sphingomonas sp. Root1294]KQY68444.1 Asp/Glu racemase [Sphingomonas sp. Root50]KRB91401.1 Asp/Glu racemase [Sphingomonas sp. Root720]